MLKDIQHDIFLAFLGNVIDLSILLCKSKIVAKITSMQDIGTLILQNKMAK